MFMFSCSHLDPGSAFLNVLELLGAPVRDLYEDHIAVVQSWEDKGMGVFFCI